MGSYIINSLEEGEQILLQGNLHWTSVYQYIFSTWLLLLMTIGLFIGGFYTSQTALYIISALFCVIAIILYLVGKVVQSRSEFVVTNNRFIQKDGILNVKMTEIPLFKIETVNFYQSFGQRLLGTGSIELVGSGGTFHRVNYIKKPLTVRKAIVGAINKNGGKDVE